MKFAVFPLLMFGVILNAIAQLLLKAGMEKIGHFNFTLNNVLPIGTQIAFNPYILLGLMCYVLSVAVWLLVLSRIEVSIAYPMVSLGYVINALAAYYLFGESLSWSRMIGIGVILFGVYLVAQS